MYAQGGVGFIELVWQGFLQLARFPWLQGSI